jgi:4-amino-4-deoxy-L-arabinose transferase-like glycosyltransferase
MTLPHLGQGDWRTDTGRYAAIGLQAWEDGYFWVLRTHPDHPWFNKPPLAIWIHGLALHLAGPFLLVARLPSVAAAAMTLLATIWMVRATSGRNAALTAGVVLALTYEFFRRTREVSLDLWQLFFLVASAGAWLRALLGRQPQRWGGISGVFLGFALLCKPLVALVAVPLFAASAFAAARPRRLVPLVTVLALALAVAAPWHLSMIALHGDAFTAQYFGAEIADRAAGQIRAQPPWYYLSIIAETYWPWLLPFILGIIPAVRGRLGRSPAGARFAVIWFAGWLLLISIFPDKAPRYAIVLYPASAWIAALALATRAGGNARRLGRRGLVPFTLAVCLGAAVFAALPVRVQRPPDPAWIGAFEVIAAQPGRPVASIDIDTNQGGRFRLRGLPWPTPIQDPSQAPPGALILRTPEPGAPTPPGEHLVYQQGRVMLTEREALRGATRTAPHLPPPED